jgi:hypothetical protein
MPPLGNDGWEARATRRGADALHPREVRLAGCGDVPAGVTRLSPEAGKLGRCLDALTVRLDASTLSGHLDQVTLAYLVAEGLAQVSEVSR